MISKIWINRLAVMIGITVWGAVFFSLLYATRPSEQKLFKEYKLPITLSEAQVVFSDSFPKAIINLVMVSDFKKVITPGTIVLFSYMVKNGGDRIFLQYYAPAVNLGFLYIIDPPNGLRDKGILSVPTDIQVKMEKGILSTARVEERSFSMIFFMLIIFPLAFGALVGLIFHGALNGWQKWRSQKAATA